MLRSRYGFTLWAAVAFAAVTLWVGFAPAAQSETGDQNSASQPEPITGDDIVQPSESHVPKSPLKLSSIDYQDEGNGAGKLKLAGIALPGKELHLFLDDQPLTNVLPDDSGNWSVESDAKLGDGRHTVRADQYDTDTNMLAARAMITFEQAKQPPKDEAPAEPPKGATP
jgi:hypothetical protein